MAQYKLLIKIIVEHEFFSGSLCQGLDFIPTESSQKIIANAGLIIKKESGGVSLFYKNDDLEVLHLFADDPGKMNFCFKVYSQDSFFLNYTDLPKMVKSSILYFDNRLVRKRKPRQIELTKKKYVSEKEFVDINSEFLEAVLSKKDKLIRPLFVVNICAKDKIDYLFDEQKNITSKEFLIRFNTRKVYWKYILPFQKEPDCDLHIFDEKGKNKFIREKNEILPEGMTGIVFKSKEKIPLIDRSPYRFQLREKKSLTEKIIKQRLSVPSVKLIQGDKDISEIFINCYGCKGK